MKRTIQKGGVSLITLIVTVTVIIIMATIALRARGDTIDDATIASFKQELKDVEVDVSSTRINNQKEGIGEEYKEKGFYPVIIENPPKDFVSFENEDYYGYVVDLENINNDDTKRGLDYKKYVGVSLDDKKIITFGESGKDNDVYIYDATGKVFYAKGFYTKDGVYYSDELVKDGPIINVEKKYNSTTNTVELVIKVEPVEDGAGMVVRVDNSPAISKSIDGEYKYAASTNGSYIVTAEENEDRSSIKRVNVSEIEAKTYTITYHFNDGVTSDTVINKDENKSIRLLVATREGYTLVGWAKSASNVEADYKPKASFNEDADTDLYAIWKRGAPKEYTISFNANGGSYGIKSVKKLENEVLELPVEIPTREGYTFLHWSEASMGGDVNYSAGGDYAKDENKVLFAIWVKGGATVNVEVNPPDGGNVTGAGVKEAMSTCYLTANPKEGYYFDKWVPITTNIKLENSISKTIKFTMPKEEVRLRAYFRKFDYSIKYNANNGKDAPATQYKNNGIDVNISGDVPTRDGFIFKGWADSYGSNVVKYMPNDIYDKNVSVVLYAVWEKVEEKFILKYDANGGTSAPIEELMESKTEHKISSQIPIRPGYVFEGWSTDPNSKNVEYLADEKIPASLVKSNITLYAHWQSEKILSIANVPKLVAGMKAVYWNGNTEITSKNFSANMYKYALASGYNDEKQSKWANAKTEDGSYWVWIPRYAYKITYYQDAARTKKSVGNQKTQYGDINILFMYGLSSTEYRDKNGDAVPLPEGYVVHPAFQKMTVAEQTQGNPLGKWNEELEGIWVAKYEASMEKTTDGGATWKATSVGSTSVGDILTSAGGLTRMVSKPSVNSWRYIRQSYIYQNSLNMYPEMNSHEMKNSEWGAVAYLTYSPYGRNGNELAVNQCSDYYTGGGPGTGSSNVYNETYTYNASTFKDTYAWNTEQGKKASTTGNEFGVYDMSGGAQEYTATYINNGSSYITGSDYGGMLGTTSDMKTKQVYPSTTNDTTSNASIDYNNAKNVYGDAVYETSLGYENSKSWCSDFSKFPYGKNPFFVQGGTYDSNATAGIFGFHHVYGYYYEGKFSFRPVLCIGENQVVVFDANGGTCSLTNKSVTRGGNYGELPTPTRTGYIFEGWYTQKEGGSKVNSSSIISAYRLYARWRQKTTVQPTISSFYATNYIDGEATITVTGTAEDGIKGWYTCNAGGSLGTDLEAEGSTTYIFKILDTTNTDRDIWLVDNSDNAVKITFCPGIGTTKCYNATVCTSSYKDCPSCHGTGNMYCGGTLTWKVGTGSAGPCEHGNTIGTTPHRATCSICRKVVETVNVYSGCPICISQEGYNTTVPTKRYCTVEKPCSCDNGKIDNECTIHNITGTHYVCGTHDWIGTTGECSGATMTCTLPIECSTPCVTCGGTGTTAPCDGTNTYKVDEIKQNQYCPNCKGEEATHVYYSISCNKCHGGITGSYQSNCNACGYHQSGISGDSTFECTGWPCATCEGTGKKVGNCTTHHMTETHYKCDTHGWVGETIIHKYCEHGFIDKHGQHTMCTHSQAKPHKK